MKTPDEIKKGLECCVVVWMGKRWKTCDGSCSYIGAEEMPCKTALHGDALAYIQQLEARIPRWIPVEERLPETGSRVLVCFGSDVCEAVYAWKFGFDDLEGYAIVGVTHWMPLPEPPEEVQHD